MLRGERRESSKQGLQNLLRLTAQRSIEDAEEIERERRRRARTLSGPHHEMDSGEPPLEGIAPHEDILHENGFKPSCQSSQDEDEGFSDWTRKMEKSRLQHLEERGPAERGGTDGREGARFIRSNNEVPLLKQFDEARQGSTGSEWRRRNDQETLKNKEGVHEQKEEVEAGRREEGTGLIRMDEKTPGGHTGDSDKGKSTKEVKGNRAEMKMPYVSEVHLQQARGQSVTHEEEMTSQDATAKRTPGGLSQTQVRETTTVAFREVEHKPERIHGSLRERDSKELEKVQQLQIDLDGCMTAEPLYSITERTESLNQSLMKSNSLKKTQNPVLISKIDDRLEQYTQAIESSLKEARAAKQTPIDITSPPEPVATKKNLFEAGDTWNQNFTKGSPSKDAEGLKVGVTDLITQWVKGSLEDCCRNSSPKPTDVISGDVLHKKNLWEMLGDGSCLGKPGTGGKGPCSVKRYKFVVTGHGKYEKVPVNDDLHDEYTNGQSSGACSEDS